MNTDTSSADEQPREGWGWPGAARKPHYFVGAESLCGRWWWTGIITPATGETRKSDCTACARLLAKRAES